MRVKIGSYDTRDGCRAPLREIDGSAAARAIRCARFQLLFTRSLLGRNKSAVSRLNLQGSGGRQHRRYKVHDIGALPWGKRGACVERAARFSL